MSSASPTEPVIPYAMENSSGRYRTVSATPDPGMGPPPVKNRTMHARLNVFTNPVAAKFGKYLVGADKVLAESTLPKATQELVKLRASQVNGCGFCVDMHTKDAAHAGETATRLHLVAAWRE